MKLITAVLREDAVDEVQIALAQQGISGMTVSEVSGYARQRGHTEVYRGEEFSIDFIAKIRIDILARDADAELIVDTICGAAPTSRGRSSPTRPARKSGWTAPTWPAT